MNRPTISVCMPNYNHARFLEEALTALLTQSYPPAEIVVLDDHSTDDSIEILARLAEENPLIQVHRNDENQGIIAALSRLTDLARGEYILYAAADDRVLPGLLERSADLLARHPEAGLCSSGVVYMDAEGAYKGLVRQSFASRTPHYFTPEGAKIILAREGDEGWFVMGNTAVYKRSAVFEGGGFRPELHAFTDGFLSRVIALRHGACHIPEPLGAWRQLSTGYFASSRFDPVVTSSWVEGAAKLVTTTYADLFPPGYVSQMRRRLRLELRLGALLRKHDALRARAAGAGSDPTRLERQLQRALDAALKIQYYATNIWLRIRLRLPLRTHVRWKLREALAAAGLRGRTIARPGESP